MWDQRRDVRREMHDNAQHMDPQYLDMHRTSTFIRREAGLTFPWQRLEGDILDISITWTELLRL